MVYVIYSGHVARVGVFVVHVCTRVVESVRIRTRVPRQLLARISLWKCVDLPALSVMLLHSSSP